MAKRMKFSVVGLPHYTIWHLYEPSADDIKHMERMEEERKNKERLEALEREKQERIEQDWESGKDQWEKDKKAIQQSVDDDDEDEKKTVKKGRKGQSKEVRLLLPSYP